MNILEDYYKYKNISKERELELFEDINNKKNREELINSHLKLVASISKKYFFLNPSIFEDIVQDGTLGLVIAIDKFDKKLGFRFSTFASFHIHNKIRQSLRKSSFFLHIPSNKLYKIFKIINEIRKTKTLNNNDMSIEDVCDMMKCSKSQAIDIFSVIFSERVPYYEEKNKSYNIDVEKLDQKLKMIEINEMLNFFSHKDREIIRLRYSQGKSWRKIGDDIGFSHECCRKRHDKIMALIRSNLKNPKEFKSKSDTI